MILGSNQLRRNILPCSHFLYFCSWWYLYCIGPSDTCDSTTTISTRRLKKTKKPSENCDSHHVLNEVPHRLKIIGTVTLCDCLRAESNVVNGYASVRGRAVLIGLCLLFSCGAERASHARRGRVRMCCVQFDVGLHGHQQACVAHVQFVTLHYIFENVMFSSLVCNLF